MGCAIRQHVELDDNLTHDISGPQDVMQANAEGNTPLHWACLNGHTEVSHACKESFLSTHINDATSARHLAAACSAENGAFVPRRLSACS